MNHLLSVRANILYSKDKEGAYNKFHELIFLVDKPSYTSTNEGQIIRQRGVEEMRFLVSDEAFDAMIKSLLVLKDIDEPDSK